jgi:hypothetical protein
MPSAKAVYDPEEGWKHRRFDSAQWEKLSERLREQLRPFYPDKNAKECEEFGHPADAWVNYSICEAWNAISINRGMVLRLTNEQLTVEQHDILTTLNKAARVLSNVSPDLDRLFGVDADLLGARDKILELIPFVESSKERIAKQPKALKRNEADQAAAVEVAVRVLRIFKGLGGRISATADTDTDSVSDAVKILKIIGDELGLCFSASSWKKAVSKAQRQAKDLEKVR